MTKKIIIEKHVKDPIPQNPTEIGHHKSQNFKDVREIKRRPNSHISRSRSKSGSAQTKFRSRPKF